MQTDFIAGDKVEPQWCEPVGCQSKVPLRCMYSRRLQVENVETHPVFRRNKGTLPWKLRRLLPFLCIRHLEFELHDQKSVDVLSRPVIKRLKVFYDLSSSASERTKVLTAVLRV